MSPFQTPMVDDDDLATCVSCGLCLPHCPTYRVTGEETHSPRGRIAIIKNVQDNGGLYDHESADMLNTCIQCRGCEPACPSGVPYGRIISGAREALVEQGLSPAHRSTSLALRYGLKILTRPRLLSFFGRIIAGLQRLHLVPRRLSLGPLPVRLGRRLQGSTAAPDVWIFTGCVMDVWNRQTHRNTAALVVASGHTFAVPTTRGMCCGALHQHAGRTAQAQEMAQQVMETMPGDGIVLVNSAGCGAALKEYGELLGTEPAHHFAARVRDIHEWLEPLMPQLVTSNHAMVLSPSQRLVLQDPCHLRHVQKAHGAVRGVLQYVAEVVSVDDDGLCCGAGGAFSMMEPVLARQVRERKEQALRRASDGDALVVASANPGCSMFLAQSGFTVRHPIDIVAQALGVVNGRNESRGH